MPRKLGSPVRCGVAEQLYPISQVTQHSDLWLSRVLLGLWITLEF